MDSDNGFGSNTVGITVGSLSFQKRRDSDLIDDSLMSEIVERLSVQVEQDATPTVTRSIDPPVSISVFWQPIDENGVNTGPIHIYNPDNSSWEPSGLTEDDIPVVPEVSVPPIACGTVTFDIAEVKSIDLPSQFLQINSDRISVSTMLTANIASKVWINAKSNTQVSIESDGAGTWNYIIAGQVI